MKGRIPQFTADELRAVLSYSPETGEFVRLRTMGNQIKGTIAGTIAQKPGWSPYRQIQISGRIYRAHGLAWFYVHGEWPDQIDHINGDGTDNRLCNLRPATNSQNSANMKMHRDNRSGFKGASWNLTAKKWGAYIQVNGRALHLGYFDSPEEAHAAYVKSAIEHFGEFARAR